MKKTIDKKELEKPESKPITPITISFKLAGYDRLVDVDSILDFLRSLDMASPLGIDPLKVKSRATFEITYGNRTKRKVFNTTQFKRILGNDISRQITAKVFNNSLGIL